MTCILRSKNNFLNCYSFLSLQNGSVCQRKNGKGGHLQMASKTRIQSVDGFSQNSLMILVLWSCKENMQDLSFGKKTRYLIWYELAQASSKGCHKKVAEGKHFFLHADPISSPYTVCIVHHTNEPNTLFAKFFLSNRCSSKGRTHCTCKTILVSNLKYLEFRVK